MASKAARAPVSAPALGSESAPIVEAKAHTDEQTEWKTGDTVLIGGRNRNYKGHSAVVESATKAYLRVRLLSGAKKDQIYRVGHDNASALAASDAGSSKGSGAGAALAPDSASAPGRVGSAPPTMDSAAEAEKLYGSSLQPDEESDVHQVVRAALRHAASHTGCRGFCAAGKIGNFF